MADERVQKIGLSKVIKRRNEVTTVSLLTNDIVNSVNVTRLQMRANNIRQLWVTYWYYKVGYNSAERAGPRERGMPHNYI